MELSVSVPTQGAEEAVGFPPPAQLEPGLTDDPKVLSSPTEVNCKGNSDEALQSDRQALLCIQ